MFDQASFSTRAHVSLTWAPGPYTGLRDSCIGRRKSLYIGQWVCQKASCPVSVGGLPVSTRGPDVSDSGLLCLPELLRCLPEYRQERKRQEDLLCRLQGLLYPPEGLARHLDDLLRWPGGLYWLDCLLYQSVGFLYQPEVLLISEYARWPPMSAMGPPASCDG